MKKLFHSCVLPPQKVYIISKALMLNHYFEPSIPFDETQLAENNIRKYTDYSDLFVLSELPIVDEIWILPAFPCYIYEGKKRIHITHWISLQDYEDGGFAEDDPEYKNFWDFEDVHENSVPRIC